MTLSHPKAVSPGRFLTWAVAPAVALLLGGGMAAAGPRFVLVNESPSLPRGLYLRVIGQDPRVGSIVALAQPAQARSYLASLGMPAQVLLIKRVVATGGDRVCASTGQVDVQGRRLAVSARDRDGRALRPWAGCRRLGPDEVFLLGDTANSFDGRYFGPTSRTVLQGVYREVLTW